MAVPREPDEQPRIRVGAILYEKVLENPLKLVLRRIGDERDLEPVQLERVRDGLGVLDRAAELRPAGGIVVDADDERLGGGIELDLLARRAASLERDFERARAGCAGSATAADTAAPSSQKLTIIRSPARGMPRPTRADVSSLRRMQQGSDLCKRCKKEPPHPSPLPGKLALASLQLNVPASACGCGWGWGRSRRL